jgi:transcription elongation GreA/GreB family factor
MNISELENLIYNISENPSQKSIETLLNPLKTLPVELKKNIMPHIDLILDTWTDSIEKSRLKASFCLELADDCRMPDSNSLKIALIMAAKHFAPSCLTKADAVKLSRVREPSHAQTAISQNIKKIANLGEDLVFYLPRDGKWYEKIAIDQITHKISMKEIGNPSNLKNVNFEVLISDFIFLKTNSAEIGKILEFPDGFSFNDWTNFMSEKSLMKSDPETMEKIAFKTFVPTKMNMLNFEKWKNNGNNLISNAQERHPADARSVAELLLIAEKFSSEKKTLPFNSEHSEKIKRLILKTLETCDINTVSAIETLAYSMAITALISDMSETSQNVLLSSFSPLTEILEKKSAEIPKMEIWNKLPAEAIKRLFSLLRSAIGSEYIANLAINLPLKGINAVSGVIGADSILNAFSKNTGSIQPDFFLWAWKNKQKIKNKEIFSFSNLFPAISEKNTVTNFSSSSVRELKKLLLSDDNFIRAAMRENDEKVTELIALIDNAKNLDAAEKQSLIVRISRFSGKFKKHVEDAQRGGKMKLSKILSDSKQPEAPKMTSLKSYNAKIRELKNITEKQIPENSAAIAHARGYGDLRENAEYAAAKEQQKFLAKKKSDLEKAIASICPIIFAPNDNHETVQIGKVVKIKNLKDSTIETYYVLGVWDGDPAKSRLSSESKLAVSLIGKRQGDSLILPEKGEAVIELIANLPPELEAELNENINTEKKTDERLEMS